MARPPVDPTDGAAIQANVESLSAIGGVYDFVAAMVERDHAEVLRAHRIATGAPDLVELLRQRQERREAERNQN